MGRYEFRLRTALFDDIHLIQVSSQQPDWGATPTADALCLFPGWEALIPYPIAPQESFSNSMEEDITVLLEKFKLDININVAGTGGGVNIEGLPALIRKFLSHSNGSAFGVACRDQPMFEILSPEKITRLS